MQTLKQSGSIFKPVTPQDRWGYILLALCCIIALYIGFTDEAKFNEGFANEDGIVENLTTLALLAIAVLCGIRLIRGWKVRPFTWMAGTTLFALLFFFAAGEEISWGQRIFGWETGEYFMERNAQNETNLHNLVVGETKINKLIFSQMLSVVMVLYLFAVPILYQRSLWIRRTIDRFGVPVVHWHHSLVFVLLTLVILAIPAERKWEVYEMGFAVIFFLIFLNPRNSYNFTRESVDTK